MRHSTQEAASEWWDNGGYPLEDRWWVPEERMSGRCTLKGMDWATLVQCLSSCNVPVSHWGSFENPDLESGSLGWAWAVRRCLDRALNSKTTPNTLKGTGSVSLRTWWRDWQTKRHCFEEFRDRGIDGVASEQSERDPGGGKKRREERQRQRQFKVHG